MTEDSLKWDRMAVEAESRSSIYGFLSLVFGKEPSVELIRLMSGRQIEELLTRLGHRISFDEVEGSEEDLLEELVLEYTRLFLGPDPHISPHESVHRKDEKSPGLFWGDSTVDVKKFIEWIGLSYNREYHGIPDHISVEFELMQKLTAKEKEGWQDEDTETACICLEYERRFMEEHLLKWVPEFCDQVAGRTRVSFYRELAIFTKEFLLLESEHVSVNPTQGPKRT